jgi:hypothetical protein
MTSHPLGIYIRILLIFVLCCLFEIGPGFVAQAGLKLEILTSQSPEFWDYRHVSPYMDHFFIRLNIISLNADITFGLSIHLLVDISIVSTFGLL